MILLKISCIVYSLQHVVNWTPDIYIYIIATLIEHLSGAGRLYFAISCDVYVAVESCMVQIFGNFIIKLFLYKTFILESAHEDQQNQSPLKC